MRAITVAHNALSPRPRVSRRSTGPLCQRGLTVYLLRHILLAGVGIEGILHDDQYSFTPTDQIPKEHIEQGMEVYLTYTFYVEPAGW